MMNHEFEDPDLIKEIENYLRQGKEMASEEKSADLAMVREEWRDWVLEIHKQDQKMNDYLHQLQDISMDTISKKQAVVASDELTDLAKNTVQTILKHGIQTESIKGIHVRSYPTSRFKAFTVNLSEKAVPDFLPADFILFENYLSGNIEEEEPLAEALGIDGGRPTGMLTIGSKIGAITDPQTRSIMEHAVSTFPEASEITQFSYTNYYFFGNSMGKTVRLSPILLGERMIRDDERNYSTLALSEITAGDLAIAQIGLLAVKRSLS
jgi:hypothetical protein